VPCPILRSTCTVGSYHTRSIAAKLSLLHQESPLPSTSPLPPTSHLEPFFTSPASPPPYTISSGHFPYLSCRFPFSTWQIRAANSILSLLLAPATPEPTRNHAVDLTSSTLPSGATGSRRSRRTAYQPRKQAVTVRARRPCEVVHSIPAGQALRLVSQQSIPLSFPPPITLSQAKRGKISSYREALVPLLHLLRASTASLFSLQRLSLSYMYGSGDRDILARVTFPSGFSLISGCVAGSSSLFCNPFPA
jgi:hypothetical protein